MDVKIRSDYFERKKKMLEEPFDSMDIVPVDMYGKRITIQKDDPKNLEDIGEDIQEFYDLKGDRGLSE